MKIQSLLASTAIAGLLLLSGCAETGPAPTQNSESKPDVMNIETVQHESQQVMTQEVISETDMATAAGAKKLNDVTMCDKITSSSYKQECKNNFADDAILAEAQQKMDASLCGKMSTEDRKNACKIQVEVDQKVVVQSQENEDLLTKEYKIRDDAFAKLDVSKCEGITTSGVKTECKNNIIMAKAQNEKNPALCEELDSGIREECKKAASR